MTGQGRGYINRVETGNIRTSTLPIAEKIAAALDVTAQELYGAPIGVTGWLIEQPDALAESFHPAIVILKRLANKRRV